ncbi:hypothetical protein [Verrucomicrobium spinosum]
MGKNRFLTNAHVVSNSTKLIIRTMNDPEPSRPASSSSRMIVTSP